MSAKVDGCHLSGSSLQRRTETGRDQQNSRYKSRAPLPVVSVCEKKRLLLTGLEATVPWPCALESHGQVPFTQGPGTFSTLRSTTSLSTQCAGSSFQLPVVLSRHQSC